jgi:hypothetical protein
MAIRAARPDGAVRLSDLKITPQNLDSSYKIVEHDLVRGDTGYLPVFSLVPDDTKNPAFTARIDDGVRDNRRMPDLDIDIGRVSADVARDFKANRNGYSGHHTDRSHDLTERAFELKIAVPSGTIFEGKVSMKAHFVIATEGGEYRLGGQSDVVIVHRKVETSE